MNSRPPLVRLIFVLVTIISSGNNPELVAGKPHHTASTFQHNHPSPRRLAADTQGFISIDCGIAPGSYYTDDKTQIPYTSDADFTDTGINYNVSRSENPSKQLMNSFFMYGNYDSKNQLPVFKLHLGVDEWDTINFNNSSQTVRKEIIHVPKTDYIDVCLVNNGSGTPFISALELRPLGNSSYNKTESGSLLLFNRWDIGSEQEKLQVRYKDDALDRIWNSYMSTSWESITAGFECYSYSETQFKLPGIIMSTAATPKNESEPLRFFLDMDDPSQRFYLYMHFSEVLLLQGNQSRVFTIWLNGNLWSDPVAPERLTSTTIFSTNSVRGSRLSFSLQKTGESVLPPIINALEVYVIKEFSQSTTDQEDVEAIKKIKSVYMVRRNWQGDPCLPMDYQWDGLKCIDNGSPTLISLNLSYSNLTGKIHPSFSNLKSLQNLDLSYNNLTGSVPEFLAELSSLTFLEQLDRFSSPGSYGEVSDGTLSLSLRENPNLCLSVSCKGKQNQNFIVPVLASVISVLVLFLLIAVGIIWNFKRKEDTGTQSSPYSELVAITRNFTSTIGQGGFGNVHPRHSGRWHSSRGQAALGNHQCKAPRNFRAEAKLLMRVHHKNLVRLVGYCNDGTNMALIYEYMSNGNLRQRLSEIQTSCIGKRGFKLQLMQHKELEYLHNGCKPPIIHRDLKTSNILLNEKLQAKIADFGLSRDLATESGPPVSTVPAGTPGYLDPESDVYSFGIVLLELITGQPAIITPGNIHIVQWISPMIERGDIQNVVDPRLQGDFNTNSAWKALETALACVPSTASKGQT
ncbi:putative leucine-rich repeat receptor-like protein kinase [Vitis vinifera]|uniref:Putative leucine-rich repeat receptor-like protein kinase n=1 Tax=Vitis vinifera TaxID=29760 RepID=A0A438EW43_VITVI|nr:putative leucine-rich repeat receptor-like protein kinase [Vitis vinifera]